MSIKDERSFWWASATIRIMHPMMEPAEISSRITSATSTDPLGKLEVTYGYNNKKMAYWYGEYRVESPNRPDVLIAWVEQLAKENEPLMAEMLELGGEIYVYIGIHSSVLALGFDLPSTPTVSRLGIAIGLEYFSS